MAAPTFQLSFVTSGSGGGTFLAVLDTRELQATIESNNSLLDMCWQLPARAWPGAATDMTSPLFTRDLPPIELNKLYYPSSGVMRWGYVYVAFTGTQLEAIKLNPTGVLTLQTNNSTGDFLQFQNFILAASIPLWEVGTNTSGRISSIGSDDRTLHLALLCDERFWIANYSQGASAEQVPTNWHDMLQALLASCLKGSAPLGSSIPAVPSAYGFPSSYSDWLEFFQYNCAAMLEAALNNVGLMLIRSIGGVYSVITTENARTIENAQHYTNYFLRSGGNWSRNGRSNYLGVLPASITFYYPMWDASGASNNTVFGPDPTGVFPPAGASWLFQWDNDEGMFHVRSPLNTTYYYPINVTIAQAFTHLGITPPTTPGLGTKIIRDTARACGDANTSPNSGGIGPTNIDLLNALSLESASNYYLNKLYSLTHEVWNGLLLPSGSGFYSYTYYMGLDCWTKIVGDPANDEYEQLMHDLSCVETSSGGSGSSGSSGLSGSGSGSSSPACSPWVPKCPDGSCPAWQAVLDCNSHATGQYVLVCGHSSGS